MESASKSGLSKRGFTLLELLVTGAVLIVLVALLIPVVSASRREAKRAECRENLRRLGGAFQTYALVNDGYFPHEDSGSSGKFPVKFCWYDLLDPYLGRTNLGKVKQCSTFSGDDSWHSYKMNSKLEDSQSPFYQIGSSEDEANTVLLFDARTDSRGNRHQTKGTWLSAEIRHRKSSQLLFVDGKTSTHQPVMRTIGGWAAKGPYTWDWK